jgi:hypothetical protein
VSASITVHVPMTIRRQRGWRTVVAAGGEQWRSPRTDPALLKALARAFRWRRMLEDGRHESISAIAIAEKLDRGYVGTVLRLTLLAPDIIEAILSGGSEAGLARLLEPFPVEWKAQVSTLA